MSGPTPSLAPAVESSHSTSLVRSYSTPNLLLLGSSPHLHTATAASTAATTAPATQDTPSFDIDFDSNFDLSLSETPTRPTTAPHRIWQEYSSKSDIDGAAGSNGAAIARTSTNSTISTISTTSTTSYASDRLPAPQLDEAAPKPTPKREPKPEPEPVKVEPRKKTLLGRQKSWLHGVRSSPNLRHQLSKGEKDLLRQATTTAEAHAGRAGRSASPRPVAATRADGTMVERPRSVAVFAEFARRPWISRSPSPSPSTSPPKSGFRKSSSKKSDDSDDSGSFRGKLSRKRAASTVVAAEIGSDKAKTKTQAEKPDSSDQQSSGGRAGSSSGSDASNSTIALVDATVDTYTNGGADTAVTVAAPKPFSRASEYLTRIRQRPQSMFLRPGGSSPGSLTHKENERDGDNSSGTSDRGHPLMQQSLDLLPDDHAVAPGRHSTQTAESSDSSANDSALHPTSEAESLTTADTSHHASPMAHQSASRDPLWVAFKDLEAGFFKFLSKPNTTQRMILVRASLIPFLRRYALDSSNKNTKLLSPEDVERRTGILNRWWTAMLEMLDGPKQWDAGHPDQAQGTGHTRAKSSGATTHFPTANTGSGSSIQPLSGSDRPMVLDALAMIMVRPEWRLLTPAFLPAADRPVAEPAQARSHSDEAADEDAGFSIAESVEHNVRTTFVNNLMAQLALVVEKMSMRQVPISIVNFSGRACAYAFFFVPGVADILVRLWGLDRNVELVRRSADAFGLPRHGRSDTGDLAVLFPHFLGPLIWSSVNVLQSQLRRAPKMNLLLTTSATCSRVPWFAPFWLSRWRGSETDLLFIFCKYYHILMDEFLPSSLALPLARRARAPAYVLLHAQLLNILDTTIHRQAAVEAAMMMAAPPMGAAGAGDAFVPPYMMQPMHNLLRDMDENRIIALLNDFLYADESVVGARDAFVEALMALLKAAACRTSQYDHNACYMLCDFLQEILQAFDGYSGSVLADRGHAAASPVDHLDWPFWLDVCKMMLSSNNTMSEIRVLSFLFAIWDILTIDIVRKEQVCLGWLLTEDVFEKFFNNWCPMVRAYYMRLLCWRVCRDLGSHDELDGRIFSLAAQRLKTVWSHYLWLKQKAEMDGTVPPSTAPSLPQPGKRFMIVRTELNGPQLGLLVNGGRVDGRGNISALAAGFDALANNFANPLDSAGELRDGASDASSLSSLDEKKSEGGATKKKWTLLGKVLNMTTGKPDADEQDRKTRRPSTSGTSRPLSISLSKTHRVGSSSSDSGSSTGSAPIFDSAQVVFKFMLHNVPWQGQGGNSMGSLMGNPSGCIVPPVYRDRILTRPRLPAPAQARISLRGPHAARAGSPSVLAPPRPLATRRISGDASSGLVSEAKNANPKESVPADDDSLGRDRTRRDSWMSTSSGAPPHPRMGRTWSFGLDGGEADTGRSGSPCSQHGSLGGDPERALIKPTEPKGHTALLRAKYAGRALAEWSAVVSECNSFVDRRQEEGVPGLKEVEVPSLGIEGMRRMI